jgi:glycosyltransferase involved in cell wall biosynthesis
MMERTAMGNPAGATVCQLLHTLNVGGAEMLAACLARRLRGRYRFVFACLDELGTLGEQLRGEGFPVEVVQRRAGLDLGCPWRLARLYARHKVDLIQAHQYTPFFYALLSRMLSRRPVLFTEHGRHQPDYPRRKRIVANRLLLRRRDRVVAVGEAVRQALIANEGIPPRRVEVVYNGIDTARFGEAGDRDAVRREMGLPADELVVIQVARLDYLKDHGTAVRAMGQVVRQAPRARLLLVGEGPEEAAIRGQVEREGLQDQVRLLGLRRDVARLLHAADVFLLTSVSEGVPLTLIEAMAAGLPVVSTDVGGTAEVVVEGETGYLAPAKDDAALATAILRLAGDPALRQRLGEAGKARARAAFDEPRMAERYAQLYEEMLHG